MHLVWVGQDNRDLVYLQIFHGNFTFLFNSVQSCELFFEKILNKE